MKNYSTYVGRILDRRYKLLDFCGSGASGAVFRAYDAQERREVAIKLFGADEDAGNANLSFMTEARAIAALSEEHTVRLYDTGVEGNECYLVMEYVDGTTLREYLNGRKARGQKVPCSEILSCARQILQALSAAHAKEIVHRDIKPQNVILTKTGILKVTDFGVAKFAGYDAFDGDRYAIGTECFTVLSHFNYIGIVATTSISYGSHLIYVYTELCPHKSFTLKPINHTKGSLSIFFAKLVQIKNIIL